MKNYQAENVDEFIKSAPPEAQPKLNELRALVKSTVPKVEESISWGIPFYKYHGLLAGFTSLKNHVDFGLVDYLSDDIRQQLDQKGYKTGKKTIQIQFDQKIPTTEITQILKTKAQSNEAKKAK